MATGKISKQISIVSIRENNISLFSVPEIFNTKQRISGIAIAIIGIII